MDGRKKLQMGEMKEGLMLNDGCNCSEIAIHHAQVHWLLNAIAAPGGKKKQSMRFSLFPLAAGPLSSLCLG